MVFQSLTVQKIADGDVSVLDGEAERRRVLDRGRVSRFRVVVTVVADTGSKTRYPKSRRRPQLAGKAETTSKHWRRETRLHTRPV